MSEYKDLIKHLHNLAYVDDNDKITPMDLWACETAAYAIKDLEAENIALRAMLDGIQHILNKL